MIKNYAIRFVSPEGGVSLFLNGFLILGHDESGRSVTQASPYIRSGPNIFELRANTPRKTAKLTFVDMTNGDPENAPELLSMAIEQSDQVPFKIKSYEIMSEVLDFSWHEAEDITDIASFTDTLYGLIKSLAEALKNGPEDALIRLLSTKHTEIAKAVGLSRQEMDEGLLTGLEGMREMEEFDVDTVPFNDFEIVTSTDGRIANARRKSGESAIKMIDGFIDPGFSVSLAKIKGSWIITR